MSQPPNSQPPLPPEPESQNSTTSRRVSPMQTQANSFPSVLKKQTVKLLRGTIRVLEGVATKLETESPAATTEPSWWSTILGKIRSLLPENLSSKFSDTALTSIIAGIAVILVWATSSLLFGKPSEVTTAPIAPEQPPEIATAPDPEPVPTPTISISPEPEQQPKVATAPDSEPEQPPEIATAPELEPIPIPTIPTPPELSAPAQPEPVEETPLLQPEPEPTPTPVVELTPEQTLIAAIENRVAEVSNGFADNLIESIQANFEGSSLTVKVGNDWYNFKSSEQDKLAAQMLERARELDFNRLEITDTQGKLLARSPVVGKDMIILKRG